LKSYDVLVIGGGSGGCASAIRSADLGKKVALVEYRNKDGLGGTCINRGCIPTKVLLASAQFYADALRARQYGINIKEVSFDYKQIMGKKNAAIKNLKFGLQNYVLKPRGIDIINGFGGIVDPNTVEVQNGDQKELIKADNIIIATGSEPARIPAFKIDGKNVLTSDEVLEMQEIPPDMLIIGAGALGLEFAYLFSTFGCKVTVIEMLPQVVPALRDKQITGMIETHLGKSGITVKTGIKIESVEVTEEGKVVSRLSNGETIKSAKALVAIGRKLNTGGLGLSELGVAMDKDRIIVDDKMRTNISNIFAVGDIVHGPQLSHKAQREGIVAAEVIAGMKTRMDYRVIPWAIFMQPEIAAVGITEEEAVEAQIKTITGSLSFMANEKAMSMQKTAGMVKIVAREDNKQIIGAQIFGHEASILIAELALAVENGVSVESLSNTVHTHPSLPEAIMEASKGSLGKSFHKQKKV
jgi:dihydrolipoamide dehydrogenase